MKFGVAAAAAMMIAGSAQGGTVPPNRQIVVDFFNFSGARAERAEKMLYPDYVQHNPRFLVWGERMGLTSREAWVKVLPDATAKGVRLVELGGIALRRPVIVMVDADLVLAVYRGRLADPVEAGRTWDGFAFEAFGLREGRFSEHWDQVKLAPGWDREGPPLAAAAAPDAGPPPVPQPPADCRVGAGVQAANKRLMMAFLQARTASAREAMIAPGFVDHDPRVVRIAARTGTTSAGAWRQGVQTAAIPAPGPGRGAELVLADCDYAAVVWKSRQPDPGRPGASYEAFDFDVVRVQGGRIVEHWNEAQP